MFPGNSFSTVTTEPPNLPPRTVAHETQAVQQGVVHNHYDHPSDDFLDGVVDKLLANLGVIADLKEGDKLMYTSSGCLLIQEPGWMSTGVRIVLRINRWNTQEQLYKIIKKALKLVDPRYSYSQQVKAALQKALNGLGSLLITYQGDSPIVNRINVLTEHIKRTINFNDVQTI